MLLKSIIKIVLGENALLKVFNLRQLRKEVSFQLKQS